MTHLYFYQCQTCKTTATSPVRHDRYQRPLCCNLCASYMRFMWGEPITTPEQKDLANRGIVYNPGTARESPNPACMTGDGEGRR